MSAPSKSTTEDMIDAAVAGIEPVVGPTVLPLDQEALIRPRCRWWVISCGRCWRKVPAHVNRDDLTSAGMMALVVSAQGFDGSRGVPFARFAAIRIRGALMDELRGMDWAARSVRGRAREADSVSAQLSAALGRTPSRVELAAAMGVSVVELDSLRADLNRASVLSLQGFAPETGAELVPTGRRVRRRCCCRGSGWGICMMRSRSCRSGCGWWCLRISSISGRWRISRWSWG